MNVEVPDPGAGIVAGLKLAVVPVGTPKAERAIELLNPPPTDIAMVDVVAAPCTTLMELGLAETLKLDAEVTVRAMVVAC